MNPSVTGLAFDVTGALLVTANSVSNDVTLFSFASTGVAAVIATQSIAGGGPADVVFNPNGTAVYVTDTTNNTISALTVSTTALTPMTGSPFSMSATAVGPTCLVIK